MAHARRFRGGPAAGRACVPILCVLGAIAAATTVTYATPGFTRALGAPRGDGVAAKPPVSGSNETFTR